MSNSKRGRPVDSIHIRMASNTPRASFPFRSVRKSGANLFSFQLGESMTTKPDPETSDRAARLAARRATVESRGTTAPKESASSMKSNLSSAPAQHHSDDGEFKDELRSPHQATDHQHEATGLRKIEARQESASRSPSVEARHVAIDGAHKKTGQLHAGNSPLSPQASAGANRVAGPQSPAPNPVAEAGPQGKPGDPLSKVRALAPLKSTRAARLAQTGVTPEVVPSKPPAPEASPLMGKDAMKMVQQQTKANTADTEKAKNKKAKKVKPPPSTSHLPPGGPVAVIPPVPPGHREIELTTIVEDRAWVRILYDETAHVYIYQVLEPELTPEEEIVRNFLQDTLVRTLDGRKGRDADWEAVLIDSVRQAIIDHAIRITDAGARRLEYYLVRDFLGYGTIDVLMRDPMLEDISCDGPEIPLYLFHRKYESVRTNVMFSDEAALDSFVIRLAQRSRKHISVADPLLDATLPDGSRLQCTLSREVTTRGSSFTIRKFRADPLSPPDLIRSGTMSAEMAGWFWFAMEVGSSFLIAGGTASGKTTTLNAVSQFIPPEKKIVSIEDTREINLSHENWIAGVTRSGFGGEVVAGKIAGTIDMYKLLEAALRQRPEYLLVGEVRGPEALTLFQAMATGHAVYSTMHADSVQSAVYRLENEPINIPRMMLQTLDVLAIQAQVRVGEKSARRLTEVTEMVGYEPQTKELLTNTVFEWDSQTDTHRYLGKSYVLEQVMDARNLTEEQVEAEWRARVEVLEWMMDNDIRRVNEVANVVSQYYRNPKALLERIRGKAAHAPDIIVKTPMPAPEGSDHGNE
jgi:archaeal flagellar protein FlaI